MEIFKNNCDGWMFRIIKEKILQKIRNARIELFHFGNQIKKKELNVFIITQFCFRF